MRNSIRSTVGLIAFALLAQDPAAYTVEKERALGEQLASRVRAQAQPFPDAEVNAFAAGLGERLTANIAGSPVAYHFEVVATAQSAEPMCLPGGYVFIPDRSLLAARDAGEFAGLLAHCIGHTALRHATRLARQGEVQKLASIPLIVVGSWSGPHAETGGASVLLPLGFLETQRTHELDADAFGLALAARAGYAPAGFRNYVARVQPAGPKTSPLPPREMRLAKMDEVIRSLPAAPPAGDGGFARAQELVRAAVERAAPERPPTLRR